MTAREVQNQLIGMQRDERFCSLYESKSKRVMIVRLRDSKIYNTELLPIVSSIIDGISRQSERELAMKM